MNTVPRILLCTLAITHITSQNLYAMTSDKETLNTTTIKRMIDNEDYTTITQWTDKKRVDEWPLVSVESKDAYNKQGTPADKEVPAVTYAIRAKKSNIARLLLNNTNNVSTLEDTECATPLHEVAAGGPIQVIEDLIEKGANVNAKQTMQMQTPLHIATYARNVEAVKKLIEKGALVDAQAHFNFSPLHYAAHLGYLEIVKLLVHNGANVNIHTDGNMEPALKIGNKTIFKQSTPQAAPIFHAIQKGHTEIVRFFIQNGADLHITNPQGQTPEEKALQDGSPEIVQLLQSTYKNPAKKLKRQ